MYYITALNSNSLRYYYVNSPTQGPTMLYMAYSLAYTFADKGAAQRIADLMQLKYIGLHAFEVAPYVQ